MADDDDPLIGYRDMAERAGVQPSTLRSYRAAGRLPPPDDATIPDRPRWRLSTFEDWLGRRPGQGARTDLASASVEPAAK